MSDATPPLTSGSSDLPPPYSHARALLEVLAMFDPDGFPREIASGTVSSLDHVRIAPQRDPDAGPLRRMARGWRGGPTLGAAAVAALERLEETGLVRTGVDGAALMSHGTREAVLGSLDSAAFHTVARVAADALTDHWTMLEEEAYEAGQQRFEPGTERLVMVNTATLVETAGDALWRPEAHDVLFQQGYYLRDIGEHEREVEYWSALATEARRLLGADHPSTLRARDDHARAQRANGAADDAVTGHEAVLTARLRVLAPDHEDILTSHTNLAVAYRDAGRTNDAVAAVEKALTEAESTNAAPIIVEFVRETLAEVSRDLGRPQG